jgi:hypothetical protein
MCRNLLVALSLANLWYLRIWSELLTYSSGDSYLMVTPPKPVELMAVVANVIVAALFFLALREIAVRALPGRAFRFAEMLFVASLAIPLNSIRAVLANQFPYLKSPLIQLIGARGVMALAAVIGIAGAIVVFRYSHRGARVAAAVLAALSPFCAVTFGQALWRATHYDDTRYRNNPPAAPIANAKKFPRVVWFICDEWDFRLTFLDRDPTLQLPEIDRLRGQAIFAANALPPAGGTPESIPSYYTGRLISPVWYENPRHLGIFFKGDKRKFEWDEQPNVFDQARALGVNTALIEWFHPTCRVLRGITLCEWWPMALQYNSMGEGFFPIMLHQARSLFETNLFSLFGRPLTADQHTGVYRAMMPEVRKTIVDTDYGFTLVHLPIPHNPFAYDRHKGTFTLGNVPVKGYVDNLALLDLTIGDIRRAMEAAGVWDSTTVLFTSDHPYRDSEALDGKSDPRIPYLVKFAAQKEGLTYSPPFNTVVTGALLMGALRGEVTDAAAAIHWLDRNRGQVSVP